jgi:hypothetical protein
MTEIAIPELGVEFLQLPDQAMEQGVKGSRAGHEATLNIGKAFLLVYRDDDPVAPGSSILAPEYRKAILARAEFAVPPRSAGQPLKLDGHDGWAFVEVSTLPSPSASRDYTATIFVIVDQHLYRLTGDALGSRIEPPDFKLATRAISTVRFLSIQKPDQPTAHTSRASSMALPSFADKGQDFYPPTAVRLNQEGIVSIEFSVDGSGHAHDFELMYSPSRQLAQFVPAYLKAVAFRVPPDWEQAGHQNQRFRMEFGFHLMGKDETSCAIPVWPLIGAAAGLLSCTPHL